MGEAEKDLADEKKKLKDLEKKEDTTDSDLKKQQERSTRLRRKLTKQRKPMTRL